MSYLIFFFDESYLKKCITFNAICSKEAICVKSRLYKKNVDFIFKNTKMVLKCICLNKVVKQNYTLQIAAHRFQEVVQHTYL